MVIRINERVPTIVSDDSIISDNTDYEVEVRCDYEWIGSTIYAIILDENGDRYTSEPIKLVNNKFTLPAVVTKTDKLYIGFTNGTVMTTEPVIVEVKMSIKLYASGDAVPKPTPDVYFEIIQKLNAALLIAENSKQYRDEALAYKNTAGNYAEAASSSASTAQTKAAEAAASASTASGVVNTVEAKAVRAETAATNAETKAGLAQGYAAAPETKAGEAEGYASSASQSASAAATSASNAAASAQTASEKAQEFGQNTYTKSEVDAKIAAATPTDYNQLKQKVDGMIAIDETPTADTEIDISLDPDQTEYELVEKSEFDAAIEELGNDLSDLSDTVSELQDTVEELNASGVVEGDNIMPKVSTWSNGSNSHPVSNIVVDANGYGCSYDTDNEEGYLYTSIPGASISGKKFKFGFTGFSSSDGTSNSWVQVRLYSDSDNYTYPLSQDSEGKLFVSGSGEYEIETPENTYKLVIRMRHAYGSSINATISFHNIYLRELTEKSGLTKLTADINTLSSDLEELSEAVEDKASAESVNIINNRVTAIENKKYVLLNDITTTSDIRSIEFTSDSDNVPYNLSKIIVSIQLPSKGNVSNLYASTNLKGNSNTFTYVSITTTVTGGYWEFSVNGNVYSGFGFSTINNYTTTVISTKPIEIVNDVIKTIKICANGGNMLSGTKIQIYGVKA